MDKMFEFDTKSNDFDVRTDSHLHPCTHAFYHFEVLGLEFSWINACVRTMYVYEPAGENSCGAKC